MKQMTNVTSAYMDEALRLAKNAANKGEVPVGAIVVNTTTGKIIGSGANLTETDSDPTAHAEILAIRTACKAYGSPRLSACDLYVTLEPCAMCATAIAFARIRRVYFGAFDPKGGGIDHGPRLYQQPTIHHYPEVYGGIKENECAQLLHDFFATCRKSNG